ncbi:methyl-CpG-binding domain-containing protein 9-like [Mangifera indica]|uniref:methyl-CpG-binding domain-containing protein 9-like n=1 Tax=Mangifera indica TaxID=29780 RepID=UPI001CFB4346|nr:methyl-CpG-binding domain-containing protein 9-like [Mangifera indica]
MELSDSTRSPLGIDLNEIPTTSLTENPADCWTDPTSAVVVPGEEARGGICGACGGPEVEGFVVVCDGCERGFHLECAGMHGRQAVNLVEWVCSDCVESGVKSKRWPLGKRKRILDINASPPSDADGDAAEELLDARKHTLGDNSFGGNGFVAPVNYSNSLYAGNGYGSQILSGITSHAVKTGLEDILLHTQRMNGSFDGVDLSFATGSLRSTRFLSQNPSEVLLQSLREFISERQGFLDEGWHVEFRRSMNSCQPYAVYCAPDGKTFESISEVACYLGLISGYNSMDAEIRTKGSAVQEKLDTPKRRKLRKSLVVNGIEEKKELISNYCNKFSSNCEPMKIFASRSDTFLDGTEPIREENGFTGFQHNKEGLPVQFENFLVISLGHVDARPSYHDVNWISPVGYTSCWHDKITGSLFICEVSDGGDSGPVFKVRRCSCSVLSIPDGSTILFGSNLGQFSGLLDEENCNVAPYCDDYDNDISIQIILSDPCPPMGHDILTCLGNSENKGYGLYTCDNLFLEASSIHEKFRKLQIDSLGFWDEIGEISVEDHSSSSAWRVISQKLVDVCSEIFKQKGTLKFFCKHIENRRGSPNWDMMGEKDKVRFSALEKFFGSPVSINILSEFQGDDKFDAMSNVLLKWLDQDRFGLDTEFVQEIIEQLPGVNACSHYEFLKDRSNYTSSLTVGNGLLIAKRKFGIESKNEGVSDNSFGKLSKPLLVEDQDHCPPGKALCLRLPPYIIGDFYQVWEFFRRFHEILGLKEHFTLEELEEELINPWFDGSSPLDKSEKKIRGTEPSSLQESDRTGGQMLSSSENPHAFIQMETGSMKEAAQARIESVNYSRCSGVVLTKAHCSLLGVLISELQSKLAAIIDQNFESGESKSKRGRKKDADSLIPPKKGKLNMLPINEMTWPELAHRYILAFLSMDGVFDSVDITARESCKVFHCLQGDGGVLGGSLTGVVGMEADALLLAEATQKIFGCLNRENDTLTIEDEESESSGSCETKVVSDGTVPEWAKVLEPVRKLPTNVGTRIRRCVHEALMKDPPDWAKKRLEHSISKEIYKGNASGPTKKAVLSVLADVQNKELPQKKYDKKTKRKTVLSIFDIIMKQCRIVLRRAAAADDGKVFCNLLGRKLSSIDNDDEGLLGSPGMVSRPLDFRTIDMRLAVGAYHGSHESCLEDIRELWNNVRLAYGDQPDLVDLAEKLSQIFEALYEKEVVPLVQKLVEYAKSECLDAEAKREINDIIALTSKVPKAPWDEGVCKVCGVDKDDDSVLLCDTCDAEYHTYCLDPPLARIPGGNWYCPSCVVSNDMLQDLSRSSEVSVRSRGKKHKGEVTHVYLEKLRHLTAVMEEKDYWEYNVDERTFLLKFLCDELLNSALIRQHLEQCAETTAEIQHKLRSFFAEWKNLKSREETVAARVAKVETNMLNAVGNVEGPATTIRNNGKFMGQPQGSSSRNNGFIFFSDDVHPAEGGQQESELNDSNKHPYLLYSEKGYNCDNQYVNPADTEDKIKDHHAVVDDSRIPSQNNDLFKQNELPLSNTSPQDDASREIHLKESEQNLRGEISTEIPSSDHQGLSSPSKLMTPQVAHEEPSVVTNESQAYNLELSTIKSDIFVLQDSITTTESQLLKLTSRREFLGSDSIGRLYWVSAMPGMYPGVIVDGSFALHYGRKRLDFQKQTGKNSILQTSTSSYTGTLLNSEGSKASRPFSYDPNVTMASPQWVFYQTDAEVEELIQWLKDNDPKERELKESILHWRRLRFLDPEQCKNQVQDDCQSCLGTPTSSEKTVLIDYLVTKAAVLLQKKYGPCFVSEITEIMKGRGKKTRITSEDRMYRCECLEPIWPSRNHCLSCHRTFFTDVEFEDHNDIRCCSASPVFEKGKEINNYMKGNMKSGIPAEACTSEMDVETSKSGCNERASRLTMFQNEGLVCPFDFEETSFKFITKDSNKELIQEIGFIGSEGIPSLVPSASPFLSDPTLMLISPQKGVVGAGDELKAGKRLLSAKGNKSKANAGNNNITDYSFRQSAARGIPGVLKSNKPALGCSKRRDKRSVSNRQFSEVGFAHCCVVPQSSLRPLIGKVSQIMRQLKINLLGMEAALPEAALRPSKAHAERRWAWRAFVKSAETIYEMVQATIILEDMIKSEYLRNERWYWSSFSAAAKTSTMSALALRIYSLDAAIVYEKSLSNSNEIDNLKLSSILEHKSLASSELAEKFRVSRKSNKKHKEPDG